MYSSHPPPQKRDGKPAMKQSFFLILLAFICGMVGCHEASEATTKHTDPSAAIGTAGQKNVVGLGRIEPACGVIDVGAMMGDRLGCLMVQEGDQVTKGDPLAEFESRDLRGLQVEAARLSVKKAEAAELSMAAGQQKIELLKVRSALAEKDLQRLKGLPKDLITDQQRERQALVVQQAASELASAKATLLQLQCANDLALEAAQLELKTAKTQYARTQITAPCDGTILKIYVRPGETIGPKPILQMANVDRMVIVAEIYENEVKHLYEGQPVQVTSRAFLAPFDEKGIQGKVTRIGRMISVPVLKNVDPFAPADRHVVEVRVELDDVGCCQSAALTNLQVDVRFPKRD